MKCRQFALAFVYFLCVSVHGQELKNLGIGDPVPDLELKDVLNYKSSSVKLSDFRGKLLILDFWATWCGPCVAAFPKLDSLQKKFGDKIQILPITTQDPQMVAAFLAKMSKTINFQPVTVTNDNYLSNFIFQHTTLPHYVWIDESGKVVAFTQGADVSTANIGSYLSSRKFDYALKIDQPRLELTSYVFPPFIQVRSGNEVELKQIPDSAMLVHSSLTKYVEGLLSLVSFDSTYVIIHNGTVATIYKTALYGNNLKVINTTTMVIDIPDDRLYESLMGLKRNGERLNSPGLESLAWLKQHGYSYQINVRRPLFAQKYQIMLSELNQYFGPLLGIEGVLEKRNQKYLALVRTSQEDKLMSKANNTFLSADKFGIQLQHYKMLTLVGQLAQPLQTYPPVIDETNYDGLIDIELNCKISDLNALNEELGKYDLKLVEKEKEMEVAVIRMKSK